MRTLPESLYDAAGCRALDRGAIEDCGIAGLELMQRAGEAAFAVLRSRWPAARRLAVVCGSGNNGGDGYVVARAAVRAGLSVDVRALGDPRSDDARAARATAAGAVSISAWDGRLPDADVVVDAILGTGLSRAPEGAASQAINAINHSGRPVLALDLPSGLDSDTGAVPGIAVQADLTITFIGLKLGLFTGEGRERSGEIRFDDLQVPEPVYTGVSPVARRITAAAAMLPRRRRDAHKGQAGHVLVAGGDHSMAGAVRMAGEAAARVGAGLVSIATRHGHAPIVNASRPELMVHTVEDADTFRRVSERATVVAIGPGLGRTDWSRRIFDAALGVSGPKVIDADGLNLLAGNPAYSDDWVLTPHPGEAGRLLASDAASVQRNRLQAANAIVARYGGVCVLKGSGTLVVARAVVPLLCDRGNPGMASGGMGDVLTGVIAGFLARGLPPIRAAAAGVWIHAAAADAVAAGHGEIGMLASDLYPELQRLVNADARHGRGAH